MAARERKSTPSIAHLLQENPYEFEYHQALRILERLAPHKTPLGEGFVPHNEAVILKSRVFLDWPPSDLYSLEAHPSDTQDYTLWVNFFGLGGAPGPLPLPYTERILDRLKSKDPNFAEFLNIFNHRLLSILYRIRKKYWVGVDFKKPHESKLAQCLFALIGLDSEALKNRLEIPDRALLYYSGLLWQRPKSMKGCEAILKHYFKVPVELSPFKGKWRFMEASQYTHIGLSGQYQALGETAALGKKAWDPRGYLEVKLGPLNFSQFESFLKKGSAYKVLCEILRFYLSPTRQFRIRLSLAPGEMRQTRLSSVPKKGSYLGWTSWIYKTPPREADQQVVLI